MHQAYKVAIVVNVPPPRGRTIHQLLQHSLLARSVEVLAYFRYLLDKEHSLRIDRLTPTNEHANQVRRAASQLASKPH